MKRPILALGLIAAVAGHSSGADGTTLPGNGFPSSRYETLWTKSPFAVATTEAAPDSPDYSLVGFAQFDGIGYASLLDKKSQEHFLVTSDKPARGLKLIGITPANDQTGASVVFQREGESFTLKLEQAPPVVTVAANEPPQSQVQPPSSPQAASAEMLRKARLRHFYNHP